MKLPHQFVRSLFYVALGCAALAALLVALVLSNTVEANWIDGLVAYLILASFGGLFASVILANFVHCPSCAAKAMIFPDSPEANANSENLHQPWRTHCGHCDQKL
mgnify:CR=1 FL=1